MSSWIPPKCLQCGDSLIRISNVNSNLICVNNACKQIFELTEVVPN